MTGQRRVIARVLSDAADHPDVEELYRRAVVLDSRISIATVYRTVRLFEEKGILERRDFGGGRARYEPSEHGHHHHLIDVETGRQCAELQQRLRPADLAYAIEELAQRYSGALVVVERNNHGGTVLAYLEQRNACANLYRQSGQAGSHHCHVHVALHTVLTPPGPVPTSPFGTVRAGKCRRSKGTPAMRPSGTARRSR